MKDKTAEDVLNDLQAEYRKYKYLEERLNQQKQVIKYKIPEMKRALDMVTYLKKIKDEGRGTTTHYELSSHVWAEGEIEPGTDTVFLWLGANIMVEYTIDDAYELLFLNIKKGKETLEKFKIDLSSLKDRITVSEVNIARVFNWDVKQRNVK